MKDLAQNLDAVPRRRTAADMDLTGWSQDAIAGFLDAAQASVSRELDEVRAEWRQAATFDFDDVRAGQLRKIELIERGDPIKNDEEARGPLQREHRVRTAALDPSTGDKSRRGDCSAFVTPPRNHLENRIPERVRIRRLDRGFREHDVCVGENLCTSPGAPSINRRYRFAQSPANPRFSRRVRQALLALTHRRSTPSVHLTVESAGKPPSRCVCAKALDTPYIAVRIAASWIRPIPGRTDGTPRCAVVGTLPSRGGHRSARARTRAPGRVQPATLALVAPAHSPEAPGKRRERAPSRRFGFSFSRP